MPKIKNIKEKKKPVVKKAKIVKPVKKLSKRKRLKNR